MDIRFPERVAPVLVASESRRLMSAETRELLSAALDGYGERGVLDSKLRPAARLVCHDAQSSELRVEQMLTALKTEWNAILEQHHVPHGVARSNLTSRFITLCIHAFYESQETRPGVDRTAVDGARMRA